MFMCTVFSCVVGRGCLLWPVCSLGKTLLAFALLHSVLQGQICLLLQVFIDFLLVHSSLHRTVQLQLLLHYWSGHRLGLQWYWIAYFTKLRKSYFAPSTPWLCRNQIQDKEPKELHHWLWNLCLKHSSNMENRTLLSLQQFPSSSQMESRISNSMLPGDYFIFT